MEFLTPLLGNIGTVILLIIVWKSGLLKYLMEAKNGNNGIEKQLNDLETNHLHTISETLKRIEERLNDIHDGIVYLKAKQNGK